MLRDIAQKLAFSTSEIIGYEVIITDEKALIVGSTDISRLGSLHEASINILKTGKSNPDDINVNLLQGTKEGYSLPIELYGKYIGTIGITGERESVKGYCYLLKEYLETMLYKEMYMKSQILREQAKENLIKEIIMFDSNSNDEDYLLLRGEEMGYNLELPRIAVIIDFNSFSKDSMQIFDKENDSDSPQLKNQHFKREIMQIINNTIVNTKDIIVPFLEGKYIILSTVPENKTEIEIMNWVKKKSEKIIVQFIEKGFMARIGAGLIAKGIIELHESYKAAQRALEIGTNKINEAKVLFYHDYLLEDLVSYTQNSLPQKYITQLLLPLREHDEWEELSQTIYAWCESGFNQKRAANLLYIHRNTLNYRLKKISQIIKVDFMDFKQIYLLYLGIIILKS